MTNGKQLFHHPSSDLARLQREIAELKEVVGKLWKSVDAFKVSAAQAEQQTQDQIDSWKQTNLKLMDLLTAKFHETDQLTQHYSRLTSYLDKWDKRSSVSEPITPPSNTTSMPSQPGTLTGNDIRKLEQSVDALNARFNDISKQIENQKSSITNSQSWIGSSQIGIAILLIALTWVALFSFRDINAYISYLQQRAEWALIKLQRLEKVNGVGR